MDEPMFKRRTVVLLPADFWLFDAHRYLCAIGDPSPDELPTLRQARMAKAAEEYYSALESGYDIAFVAE